MVRAYRWQWSAVCFFVFLQLSELQMVTVTAITVTFLLFRASFMKNTPFMKINVLFMKINRPFVKINSAFRIVNNMTQQRE